MGSTGLDGVCSTYQGHLFFQKATYGGMWFLPVSIATGPGAPSLLTPLLEGLIWRSRQTNDGFRRRIRRIR